MTANKEDYLKMIYMLGGERIRVSNKRLSEAMGVSAASVSEMLGKLSRDGMVDYTPYYGMTLTNEGLSEALSLLRSYRLWEVFLKSHLGYGDDEAGEDAEMLEHATSAKLAQRLDRLLGHPRICPHGEPIPERATPDERL